jgi:hypothetical protein
VRGIRGQRASVGLIDGSNILELKDDFTDSPGHSTKFSFEVDATGVNYTVVAGGGLQANFARQGNEAKLHCEHDIVNGQ